MVVRYTCADAGSGVQSRTRAGRERRDLSTRQRGTFAFTVTALNRVGNRATRSLSYRVR